MQLQPSYQAWQFHKRIVSVQLGEGRFGVQQEVAITVSGQNVSPLVNQLKIVSLSQVAEIVFRCNHGSAASALKDKLRRNNHGARKRGSKESYLPYRPSSLSGELSFSNRASLMWNTLLRAMQQISSRTSFENFIKAKQKKGLCFD